MASTTPKPCPEPPERLFHSTDAKLTVGDMLVPGKEAGRGRGQWVWMDSSDRPNAWNTKGNEPQNVYEVEPVGDVQTARGFWRAKQARVKRVIGE